MSADRRRGRDAREAGACRALATFGCLLLAAGASPVAAADDQAREDVAVAAGTGLLLVLGPLSGSAGMSIDAGVEGTIADPYGYAAGARLELGSGAPEAFVRFSSTARLGAWSPALGLEVGATAWSDEDSGGALLEEARAAARRDLVPVYVAVHATPLRFRAFERVAFSALELQVGTHVSPFGRYLRLHVGLLRVGVAL